MFCFVLCVSVCVCVCERERERERERVMCVCVTERENVCALICFFKERKWMCAYMLFENMTAVTILIETAAVSKICVRCGLRR